MIENTSWKITVAHYIAWLAASIGIVLDAIYFREATLDLLTLWQARTVAELNRTDPTANTARIGSLVQSYDTIIVFVLSMVAVGFAVWVEYYFRKGIQRGEFVTRLRNVFAVQFIIFAVCFLIQVLV